MKRYRVMTSHPNGTQQPEARDAPYYDHDTGLVGYGSTYGEHSYNNRPIHAERAGHFGHAQPYRRPFDPFNAPKPKLQDS